MEYDGTTTPSLLTLRTSEESAKVLKATYCILKCFLFLDICFLFSGIVMIVFALNNHISDKDLIFCGGFFGLFAAMSAMCNR